MDAREIREIQDANTAIAQDFRTHAMNTRLVLGRIAGRGAGTSTMEMLLKQIDELEVHANAYAELAEDANAT